MVSKEKIRSKLIRGWRPTGTTSFKILGDNLFLVEFQYSWDKIRVLEGRPWVFERSLFAIEDFDGVTPPSEIDFEMVEFWVRMINLPLACMCKDVGYQIGSSVGIVKEVETDDEGVAWGEYLRVRIQLDLKKPLSRGRMLKVQGRSVKVVFQYEQLPRFCFQCGCIKHGKLACQSRRGPQVKGEVSLFGPWLRAESSAQRRERESGRYSGGGESKGRGFSSHFNGYSDGKWRDDQNLSGDVSGGHERTDEELKSKGAENSGGMSSMFSDGRDVMGDETVEENQGDLGGFSGEDYVNNNIVGNNTARKESDGVNMGDSFIKELSGGGNLNVPKDIERDLWKNDVSLSGNKCNMVKQKISDTGGVGRSMVGTQESMLGEISAMGPGQDFGKDFQPVPKWKRRARDLNVEPPISTVHAGSRKRKNIGNMDAEGDDTNEKRGRKGKAPEQSGGVEIFNGSGLADAVLQHRRPQ
jgi:hypothetical protein